jgi:hypothetical protein
MADNLSKFAAPRRVVPEDPNKHQHPDSEPSVLPAGCTLSQVDGVWTIFFKGREYMRLLDAKSRDDAEQQISEMRLAAAFAKLNKLD